MPYLRNREMRWISDDGIITLCVSGKKSSKQGKRLCTQN